MAFRTLEISKPAEIHIKNGQLEVETEEGILYIPIEDLLQIITRKISNQSRALSILGLENAENVASYIDKMTKENVDMMEALSAKEYFSYYHKGLNRRVEEPVNSMLNYGYAVVRSAIARSLISAGFHPTFGIHHDNQLNAFNLADDLIEPYRAIVDLVAYNNVGANIQLNKSERREIAQLNDVAEMVYRST